jgi:hypothetical protein
MRQNDPRAAWGGLHWVKPYINDPFYRSMFREFQVLQRRADLRDPLPEYAPALLKAQDCVKKSYFFTFSIC